MRRSSGYTNHNIHKSFLMIRFRKMTSRLENCKEETKGDKNTRAYPVWSVLWSLLNCLLCVLKTCSHANVPSVLPCWRANVPCVLTRSRANVLRMLTCLACLRANIPCAFTCSRAKVPFVLTCLHANVPCVLMYLRVIVVCGVMWLRANMPWVPYLTWFAWPHDHLPTCFDASVSSFVS